MSDIANRIAQKLEAIREEARAKEMAAAQAAQIEEDRCAALAAAKERCLTACGPISEALAASTDPAERSLLIELEAETHTEHAADLEAAYATFAGPGAGASNPAQPGVTTPLASTISVTAATQA